MSKIRMTEKRCFGALSLFAHSSFFRHSSFGLRHSSREFLLANLGSCRQIKHRTAENKSNLVAVVTGGAGFLGSHFVDRLLVEGDRVIAIDNLITGSTADIRHLGGHE